MALFEREIGAIRPTPAGLFYIERARRLLFDARCVERDLSLYKDSQLGDTAIGAGPAAAATLVQSVAVEMRNQFPQIRLRVEVNHLQLLLDSLRAETIELLIGDMRALEADATLELRPLGRQHAGLFVHKEHPLAHKKISLREIWQTGIASFHASASVFQQVAERMGLPSGTKLSLAFETDDVALLKVVALKTNTVLAAPVHVVRDEVAAGELVQLQLIEKLPLGSVMGIVRLRNRTPSPAAQKIEAFLEARAAVVNTAEHDGFDVGVIAGPSS